MAVMVFNLFSGPRDNHSRVLMRRNTELGDAKVRGLNTKVIYCLPTAFVLR